MKGFRLYVIIVKKSRVKVGDFDGVVAATAKVVLFQHVVWLDVEESGDGGLMGAKEGRVRQERHC